MKNVCLSLTPFLFCCLLPPSIASDDIAIVFCLPSSLLHTPPCTSRSSNFLSSPPLTHHVRLISSSPLKHIPFLLVLHFTFSFSFFYSVSPTLYVAPHGYMCASTSSSLPDYTYTSFFFPVGPQPKPGGGGAFSPLPGLSHSHVWPCTPHGQECFWRLVRRNV